MYYKKQKLDNEKEKNAVTKDIISVTPVVEKVGKEIRLCDEVGDNVSKIKRQIKGMNEREQEKVKVKEKKKKDRRCDR